MVSSKHKMGNIMQLATIESCIGNMNFNEERARYWNSKDAYWTNFHLREVKSWHWRLILARQGIRYVLFNGKSNE